MASMSSLGLILLQVALTTANNPTCMVDDIQVQDNFDLKRYLGTWYEIYWILPFNVPDPFTDYNHDYKEVNSTHFISHITGRSYEGECFFRELYFQYITEAKYLKASGNPFWILKTDYDNYSVTYGCDEKFKNGTCKSARGWIWSRSKNISEENHNTAKMMLEQACVSTPDLLLTAQTKECISSAFGLSSYSKMSMFVLLFLMKTIF